MAERKTIPAYITRQGIYSDMVAWELYHQDHTGGTETLGDLKAEFEEALTELEEMIVTQSQDAKIGDVRKALSIKYEQLFTA